MVNRSSNHIGLAAVDGLIALAVTVSAITYCQFSSAGFHDLATKRVGFVDAVFGVSFIVLWQYCFSVLNLYDRFATLPSRMTAITKGLVTMIIPVVVHLFFFHPQFLHLRTILYIIEFLFAYEVVRIASRDLIFDWIAGRNPQHILIVGSGRRAGKAWREIRTRFHSSTQVLGFVDDRDPNDMAPDITARYLGDIDSLEQLLLERAIDIAIIAMPMQSCYPLMQRAVSIAESVGVEIIYLNDIYVTKQQSEEPNRDLFRELFPRHEHYVIRLAVKRIVDVFASAIGLILLAPILGCIALAVRLTSKGPAFFWQERFGYRRRTFRMVKFRSMVVDAEAKIAELEALNEATGPIFKMKNDPRVTGLGKFLRSTSLDELPQLWNVLMGDMSLVGPRPMSIRDVSLFSEAALMRRFSVKPGMTGLWQVNGRAQLVFDEWVELDIRYIEQWSLFMDIKILAKTILVVIKRSGAM